MKHTNLTYTGKIRGLIGGEKTIAFVTQHDEGKPTAIFKIDAETNKLTSVDLPCGGLSIVAFADQYWIGGDDQQLYVIGRKEKAAKPQKLKLQSNVMAMAALANEQVALLAGDEVLIVSDKAKLLQTLSVDESATAIAANPDGTWLAVGDDKGTVSVFQREEQDEFVLSESEKLHEGKVTSLLFEPEELRIFSAGSDNRFLVTHARGRLEPEDRGRTNNHDKPIVAMMLAGETRVVTGSLDKTCKSWVRGNATKPSTLSDGIVAVTGLAQVVVHKRTNLVVACQDNSLRLFLIDEEGRIGNGLGRYNDGFVRAKTLFESRESSDRGQAMQELADLDDRKSSEMLAERISADSDNRLRLTAAKLLTKSSHPKLNDMLAGQLAHPDSPVRTLVLETLEKTKTDGLIELYQSAIGTEKADVGTHAIGSLVKLAKKKDCSVADRNLTLAVLTKSLDSDCVEIRNAAIFGLEDLFDKKSARPNLITLTSKSPDSKRKGLIRLMQRGLLDQPAAAAGLSRAVEDKLPVVRQAAFLISVLSRPKLSDALRSRDKDMDRKLKELESFDFDVQSTGKKKTVRKTARKKVAKKKRVGE
jgi:ParB family chromosome partitioning protein